MLEKIKSIVKRSGQPEITTVFSHAGIAEAPRDFRDIYSAPPKSHADQFPDVPEPEDPNSLPLLAAKWSSGGLLPERMPNIAADLLESGFDEPPLRRLAGEMNVSCFADVECLVAKVFKELPVAYPLPEAEAKLFVSRQIAREVIHGKRNPWSAASHLEIAIWGWRSEIEDVQNVFNLRDELDRVLLNRGELPEITAALIETFARLGRGTVRSDATL